MAWFFYALLSAVAAAGMILLTRVGFGKVDVVLLTTIRSIFMTIMLIGMSITLGKFTKAGVNSFSLQGWFFLVLTAILAGFSWIFYFAALKTGMITQVEAIARFAFVIVIVFSVLILGEPLTLRTSIGIGLLSFGIYLISFR